MAEIGRITVEGQDIISVDSAPDGGGGIVATEGSLALVTDGTMYIKDGSADTAWLPLSALNNYQGSDVASANNLALNNDGDSVEITGVVQVNLLSSVGWRNGSRVTLLFTSTPTVKHNQATTGTDITIQLAGAVDFVATAGDTLTLMLSEIGGTQAWREVSRAVI
jgi:hypothetical protein